MGDALRILGMWDRGRRGGNREELKFLLRKARAQKELVNKKRKFT
jgi:hypothetical protein